MDASLTFFIVVVGFLFLPSFWFLFCLPSVVCFVSILSLGFLSFMVWFRLTDALGSKWTVV